MVDFQAGCGKSQTYRTCRGSSPNDVTPIRGPGVKTGTFGHVLWVGGTTCCLCPVNHSDTTQSWTNKVSSCMRKRADGAFLCGCTVILKAGISTFHLVQTGWLMLPRILSTRQPELPFSMPLIFLKYWIM